MAVFLSIQHDLFAPFSLRRDTWRVLCGLLRSLSRPCCYVDVRWQRWWAVVGGGGCDLRQAASQPSRGLLLALSPCRGVVPNRTQPPRSAEPCAVHVMCVSVFALSAASLCHPGLVGGQAEWQDRRVPEQFCRGATGWLGPAGARARRGCRNTPRPLALRFQRRASVHVSRTHRRLKHRKTPHALCRSPASHRSRRPNSRKLALATSLLGGAYRS